MTAREARLMALMRERTSDPAWRRVQELEERRKLAEFVVRLLAWDRENGGLAKVLGRGASPWS